MRLPATEREDPDWWSRQLPRVEAFVRRRLGSRLARIEAVSDIVQSACRELLEDLSRTEASAGILSRGRWLRLALRKIVQKHRHHTAARRDHRRAPGSGSVDAIADRGPGPLESVVLADRAAALVRALHGLPEHYRRIIEWVHFERLTHAETGRRLGRSEDASKMLLSRAMARLAQVLAEVAAGSAVEDPPTRHGPEPCSGDDRGAGSSR